MEIDVPTLAAGATVLTSDVIAMYRMGAEITNTTIAAIAALCQPGARIAQLCEFGDLRMREQLAAVFNRGQVEKGMAHPTTVCVNACVDNFSPLPEDTTALDAGDVAKITLGVQIDGHVVMGSQTVVVGATAGQPIVGPSADVVCAATMAAEAVLRLLRPGTKSLLITKTIEAVAAQFGCAPVQETSTVNTQRFVRAGLKAVLNASRPVDADEPEFVVEESEAYHVNIVMSTGSGAIHTGEPRTTVYERVMDSAYNLKLKASRAIYLDISQRFPTMPFPLRELDPKSGAFGIKECVDHGLVREYPVRFVKAGEVAAQVQFTVLVTAAKTVQLNGLAPPFVRSEYGVTDAQLQTILALPALTGISDL